MTDISLPWTAAFVGLNGLIGFALSWIAVNARTRSGVWHGEQADTASDRFAGQPASNVIARMVEDKRTAPSDGSLQRAVRAHGNFAEYVPHGLLFVLVLEMSGKAAWLAIVTGGLLTLGRIIYSAGVLTVYGPSPMRFTGFMMTWAAYLMGSGACLWVAIAPGL